MKGKAYMKLNHAPTPANIATTDSDSVVYELLTGDPTKGSVAIESVRHVDPGTVGEFLIADYSTETSEPTSTHNSQPPFVKLTVIDDDTSDALISQQGDSLLVEEVIVDGFVAYGKGLVYGIPPPLETPLNAIHGSRVVNVHGALATIQ